MKFDDLFNNLMEQSNPYAPVKSVTAKEEIPSGDQYKVKSVHKTLKPRRTAKGGAGAPPGLDIDKTDKPKKMVARRGKGPGPKTLPPELQDAADKAEKPTKMIARRTAKGGAGDPPGELADAMKKAEDKEFNVADVAAGVLKKKFGGGGSAGRRVQKEASVTFSKDKDEPEIRDSKGNVVKPSSSDTGSGVSQGPALTADTRGKSQKIDGLQAAIQKMINSRKDIPAKKNLPGAGLRTPGGMVFGHDKKTGPMTPDEIRKYDIEKYKKDKLGQKGAMQYDIDLYNKTKPSLKELRGY